MRKKDDRPGGIGEALGTVAFGFVLVVVAVIAWAPWLVGAIVIVRWLKDLNDNLPEGAFGPPKLIGLTVTVACLTVAAIEARRFPRTRRARFALISAALGVLFAVATFHPTMLRLG